MKFYCRRLNWTDLLLIPKACIIRSTVPTRASPYDRLCECTTHVFVCFKWCEANVHQKTCLNPPLCIPLRDDSLVIKGMSISALMPVYPQYMFTVTITSSVCACVVFLSKRKLCMHGKANDQRLLWWWKLLLPWKKKNMTSAFATSSRRHWDQMVGDSAS